MVDARPKTWMVQTDTQIAGPYTLERLRQLAAGGHINRSTLLKAEGQSGWMVAGQLPAIFNQPLHGNSGPTPSPSPHRVALSATTTPASQSPSAPPDIHRSQATTVWTQPQVLLIVGGAVLFGFASLALAIAVAGRPQVVTSSSQANAEPPKAAISIEPKAPVSTPTAPVPSIPVDETPSVAKASESFETTVEPTSATKLPNLLEFRSTEELVKHTQHAVAIVVTSGGFGSGFLVDARRLATNYHVIADAEADDLKVFFPDSETHRGPFEATIVAELPDRDLAILEVPVDTKPLSLAKDYRFRRGQDIVVIGSPGLGDGDGLLPNAVTRGVLSSTTVSAGQALYQLSLAVNPGNSGGPVIGLTGEVIGVVVSKSTKQEAIGFAVPVSELIRMLETAESGGFESSSQASALHNARTTIRALIHNDNQRAAIYEQLFEILESNHGTSNSRGLHQAIEHKLANEAPQLLHSFDQELRAHARNPSLSAEVRRAIERLAELQQNLESLYDAPPQSASLFLTSIQSRTKRLLSEVGRLNRTLEIGMPELSQ